LSASVVINMVLYCNIHIDTLLQNIVIFKLLMIL